MDPGRVLINTLAATMAIALLSVATAGCGKGTERELAASSNGSVCKTCHGSSANAAPPRAVHGDTSTSSLVVGAHQAHINAKLTRSIDCSSCHAVPSNVTDTGHILNQPARVRFSGTAAKDSSGTWNRSTGTCVTYCHGSTLHGGQAVQPLWTKVDGTQKACTSCHGFPPPAPHPQISACHYCHGRVVGTNETIIHPELHIDGQITAGGSACNSCHGGSTSEAPPSDISGNTSTSARGVGAHQSHLTTSIGKTVECSQCHPVPVNLGDANHMNGTTNVVFGALANSNGVTSTWDTSALRCATYCHGATLSGGQATQPVWTTVNGSQKTCTSCHGFPPGGTHPASSLCHLCHGDVIAADESIGDLTKHIDGTVQASGQNCNSCHGGATSNAPPRDTHGNTATTARGVGAHQIHLSPTIGKAVLCSQCHVVPAQVVSGNHLNGTVNVTFGSIANADGVTSTWNTSTLRCATYCHGASLAGGDASQPLWTKVDGTQKTCSSCHGYPPPSPHPQSSECSRCHWDLVGSDNTTIIAPNLHVDGVSTIPTMACNACHGGATNYAPPKDTYGNTVTTVKTVGAHQKHLAASAITSTTIPCSECHTVPATVTETGHMLGTSARVLAGPLASRGGASPAYDSSTGTCSSIYCHGAYSGRYDYIDDCGNPTFANYSSAGATPKFNDGAMNCSSCHGDPPSNRAWHTGHNGGASCQTCHPDAAGLPGASSITNPSKHMDGTVDVAPVWKTACFNCHNC